MIPRNPDFFLRNGRGLSSSSAPTPTPTPTAGHYPRLANTPPSSCPTSQNGTAAPPPLLHHAEVVAPFCSKFEFHGRELDRAVGLNLSFWLPIAICRSLLRFFLRHLRLSRARVSIEQEKLYSVLLALEQARSTPSVKRCESLPSFTLPRVSSCPLWPPFPLLHLPPSTSTPTPPQFSLQRNDLQHTTTLIPRPQNSTIKIKSV